MNRKDTYFYINILPISCKTINQLIVSIKIFIKKDLSHLYFYFLLLISCNTYIILNGEILEISLLNKFIFLDMKYCV